MFKHAREAQTAKTGAIAERGPAFAGKGSQQAGSVAAAFSQLTLSEATTVEPPLCVDLDGTLVTGDTLKLSLRQLLLRKPWTIFYLSFRVLHGRAAFKHSVARLVELDPARLPYRSSLVEFLHEQKAAGRRLILATAAPEAIARSVAAHLGLFTEVIASGERHNAKGRGKVEAIRNYLQRGEFDYIGDSFADLPVFRAARRAILVEPSERLLVIARRDCCVQTVFRS